MLLDLPGVLPELSPYDLSLAPTDTDALSGGRRSSSALCAVNVPWWKAGARGRSSSAGAPETCRPWTGNSNSETRNPPLSASPCSECSVVEGSFTGEELLSWGLSKTPSIDCLPMASSTLTTLSTVEAFYLPAMDLAFITSHFKVRAHMPQRHCFSVHLSHYSHYSHHALLPGRPSVFPHRTWHAFVSSNLKARAFMLLWSRFWVIYEDSAPWLVPIISP